MGSDDIKFCSFSACTLLTSWAFLRQFALAHLLQVAAYACGSQIAVHSKFQIPVRPHAEVGRDRSEFLPECRLLSIDGSENMF